MVGSHVLSVLLPLRDFTNLCTSLKSPRTIYFFLSGGFAVERLSGEIVD
jgi:hypothetical protein